ncbi:hypothetical protein [Falsiruegeria mediterranea]|uniref:Uncharacterized protein n=1 Tax=Falsiruegeria mediterranea M17 TaxID=1200281 RepID=A0A2R8CAE9_9RHOB|nr:hypothetical protein [Falsiruegeria mediterranea]SPJ29407.1 hypothetical protein TRM7615_02925 [Falsiruegeria mediterranea M17]
MNTKLSPATRALLEFLFAHDEALQNAALLLGGAPALRRVQSLLDSLSRARHLTRKVKLDLVALYQVLSLENVGYPDTLETALFADLDPSEPMVEDICLLTDGLRDRMESIDKEAVIPVFDFELAA